VADVFISHQHEDRAFARLVAESLEGLGFSVWWDFKMRAGDSFRESIEAMLRAAKVVIVLWSPGAVQSRFVRSEAARAQAMGKLAPAMIADAELPLGLDEAHAIDLTRWRGEVSDENFQALLRELETRVGRPATLARANRTRSAMRPPGPAAVRDGHVRAPANHMRLVALAVLCVALIAGVTFARRAAAPSDAQQPGGAVSDLRQAASSERPALSESSAHDQPPRARSQAELLAIVESLPFDGRAASADARRDFTARESGGPFNVRALHPSVRRAVREALRASTFAHAAALRARIAAQRGERAARSAEAGAPGTIIENVGERHWATDWANDAHNGFGVLSWRNGDRYAGAWRDGRFEGPGVFRFENVSDPAANTHRYEGGFSAGKRSGSGVIQWRNGERYAGGMLSDARDGAGVMSYAGGTRYEGQWRAGKREGAGVLWSAQGEALESGLWRRDRLETSLAP
jgi:hypothetical protein